MELVKHISVFSPDTLKGSLGIIGVGAAGSALALEFAKLGITDITLYDNDAVEAHNLPNQILYGPADEGQAKVLAASAMIKQLTGYAPKIVNRVAGNNKIRHSYIACCVDSMDTQPNGTPGRRLIFDKGIFLNGTTELYMDVRMTARSGSAYIFNPCDPVQVRQYRSDPDVMYYNSDVLPDTGGCGVTQSIGPTAHILAGAMAWMFIMALRDERKVGELLFRVDPWMMMWRPFTTAATY